MAELAAKNKKAAAETRLLIQLKILRELVTGPAERRPTEQRLKRELAATRTSWGSYDLAHFGYLELLETADEVIEQEAYCEHSQTVHDVIEQAEDLLDTLRPAAVQVPQHQVATIEACLEPAAEEVLAFKCKQELEELTKELNSAALNMQAAALLIKEMNKLKPDLVDDDVRSEAEMKVRTAEVGIKAQPVNYMPRPPEVKCDEETLVTNKLEETEPTHAKKESLRVLMRSTALKVDDVLEDFTCLEDMERSRIVFWAELSRLDLAEEEERNSGKKEEELKYLSIRQFKRAAMAKFARCVELLNEAKLSEPEADLKADAVVESEQQKQEGVSSNVAKELMLEKHSAKAEEAKLSSQAEVAMICLMALQDMMKAKEVKMSTKSKPEVMMTCSKTWLDEMKLEEEERDVADLKIDKEVLDFMIKDEVFEELNMAKLIRAAKDEAAEEVRKLRLSDESEKEEHEAVDIMIDKEDGSGNAEAAGQDVN